MRHNPMVEIVKAEAERFGMAVEILYSAGHSLAVFTRGDKRWKLGFSSTPSDRRAFWSLRRDVRRKLSEVRS